VKRNKFATSVYQICYLNITIVIIIIIIIIMIFLHGLDRLTCSGIAALPSFPGAPTISSFSRFVVEGVVRESGVFHSFKVVDTVLFVFESHDLYSRDLNDLTGYTGGNFVFLVGPPKPDRP
jgi:hypothetical protein